VAILLVELRNLSWIHHSLQLPYIVSSPNFWSRSKQIGPHYSQAVNRNVVGVPSNIVYLQNLFKRYTQHAVL